MAILLFLVTLSIGLFFYRKQNQRPELGGVLSLAKAFWLIYAVYTWFLFMPYNIYVLKLPPFVNQVWMIFWFWMLFRGIIEIFMMYVTKNWSPVYGISHDFSCLLILIGGTLLYWHQFLMIPKIVLTFHFSLILSLFLETYYAWGFFKIVKEKTKGEEAIWFASKEDPRFKRLVILTNIMNWPLYLILVIYLYFLTI